MRRATLADVATLAGVSKSAVSRVLSGTPSTVRISDATMARIYEAARQLDYQPNAAARALGRKRTETIALVVPASSAEDHSDHRFSHLKLSELLSGIDQITTERGFHLIVQIAGGDPFEDPRHAQIWKNGAVDGVLWLAMPLDPRLNQLGCPIVGINCAPDDRVEASTVNADHYEAGRIATEHLIRLGHTSIAHISAPRSLWVGAERERGYVDAMTSAGYRPRILEGDSFEESGVALARELMASSMPPTAIFCGGDLMAFGALRAAQRAGVNVPDDLALIGSDGMKLCHFTTPSLSTVRMTMHRAAAEAAAILIDDIEGTATQRRHLVAPIELVIRESCGFHELPPGSLDELAVPSPDALDYELRTVGGKSSAARRSPAE